MNKTKDYKLIAFRLPLELVEKIDEFAKKLELIYLPPLAKNQGYRSEAIRLCVEDTLTRFFGPKDDPDELISPHYNEMSKIIPVLKNIRLRGKLENMSGDNQEKIDKIMKEYD